MIDVIPGKYILTICIPTYNRCSIIKENLILNLKLIPPKVCVLVHDNGSSDGTKEVVENIAKNDNRVTYYCNEKNLGVTQNFLLAFQKVETEYIFSLSDEDIVERDFLKKIIPILESGKMNFVSGVVLHADGKPYMYRFRDGLYSAENAIAHGMFHFNYCSGYILRKKLIDFKMLNWFDQNYEWPGTTYLCCVYPALFCIIHGNVLASSQASCSLGVNRGGGGDGLAPEGKVYKPYYDIDGRLAQAAFFIEAVGKIIQDSKLLDDIYRAHTNFIMREVVGFTGWNEPDAAAKYAFFMNSNKACKPILPYFNKSLFDFLLNSAKLSSDSLLKFINYLINCIKRRNDQEEILKCIVEIIMLNNKDC